MRTLLLVLLVGISSTVASTQTQFEAALPPAERFSGTVQLRAADGRSVGLRVSLRNWSLRGSGVPQPWSEQGFVVMQLLAGSVRTTIDGKAQDRREGEFWSASDGTRMTIEVLGEMATLQSLAVVTP